MTVLVTSLYFPLYCMLSLFNTSNSCGPHGLQLCSFSCPWDSPEYQRDCKCLFAFLQVIFTQGSNPCFLLSPALAGEFLGRTWEAHIFLARFQYSCPKDTWRGPKIIIFIFAQFAAIWKFLKCFCFVTSTNILFFVQKLCELHVLTTPLSYL